MISYQRITTEIVLRVGWLFVPFSLVIVGQSVPVGEIEPPAIVSSVSSNICVLEVADENLSLLPVRRNAKTITEQPALSTCCISKTPEVKEESTATAAPVADVPPDNPPAPDPETSRGFQWSNALKQSASFVWLQHAFRMALESDMRAELKGPFFKDYWASVKRLRGWDDGDPFVVNYIGHPMMGSVAGYIQIQNDAQGRRQQPAFTKQYFHSRLKAFGWSAVYSLQFELGPISEASLGNVGMRPRKNGKVRHPMAYEDLVVTPVLGTTWLIGEDVIDKYVIRRIENKMNHRVVVMLSRTLLNPTRSVANMLRGKWFWYRDTRQ
ncbi:MAG: hypothetical protein JNM09_18460 [Blastocatellia bacterium]|nr:hypothetical protein [Blastocatellia bacterium]